MCDRVLYAHHCEGHKVPYCPLSSDIFVFCCFILLSQSIPKQPHSFSFSSPSSCHFTCLLLLSLLGSLLHLCPLVLFYVKSVFSLLFFCVSTSFLLCFPTNIFSHFFHFSCFHHVFIIFHFFFFTIFHLFHLIVFSSRAAESLKIWNSQRNDHLSTLCLLVPPPVSTEPLARTLWHLDLPRGTWDQLVALGLTTWGTVGTTDGMLCGSLGIESVDAPRTCDFLECFLRLVKLHRVQARRAQRTKGNRQ